MVPGALSTTSHFVARWLRQARSARVGFRQQSLSPCACAHVKQENRGEDFTQEQVLRIHTDTWIFIDLCCWEKALRLSFEANGSEVCDEPAGFGTANGSPGQHARHRQRVSRSDLVASKPSPGCHRVGGLRHGSAYGWLREEHTVVHSSRMSGMIRGLRFAFFCRNRFRSPRILSFITP